MTSNEIIAYGAYVPRNALDRATVGAALGTPGGPGSRSVAGFDEDAVTMGVAALDTLETTGAAAAPFYFATSNPPFLDKTNANLVKATAGGDDWRLTVDLGGLRGGFAALSTAAATGGVAVLADHRGGRPGSTDELDGGDGAAAFVFGHSDAPIARVVASTSRSMELMDVWRVPGEEHATTWEERFSQHVLVRAIQEVATQVGKDGDFTDTPTYTLVATPSQRFGGASARAVGATGEADLLSQHRAAVGFCGAADIGLLLVQALDAGKAGDKVLLVSAAGSVDAMLVEVLRDGPGLETWHERLAARRRISYVEYLTWRGQIEREPSRRPERPGVAAPPAYRNASWKYALEGGRCESCGKVYLPAPRVCGGCGTTDRFEPYSVRHRRAVVQSITTDGVSDSPAPSALAALVDFEGGGRLTVEVADSTVGETRPGDTVEMVFRRTYRVRGVPNYFWKARPVEGAAR